MRTAIPRVVVYSGSETSKFVVEGLRVEGKRVRKFFKKRRAANAWLRKTLARVRKEGEGAVHMPDALRVSATAGAAKLAPYGKTLDDAIRHYLAHLSAVARSCTVNELSVEFQKAKLADGARDLYLKDIRLRLARFSIEFGERIVAEIRGREIDHWLRALELSAQSRKNFRTVLATFFQYAVDQDFAPENPVQKTAKAKVDRPPPVILTPAQMRTLLEKAPLDLVPWLAIGGFAGLRSAEIERLDWREIDLAERLIKLPATKSKTRRKRNVQIPENLAQWLAPLAQKSGIVADFERIRVARAQTVKAAEMNSWPSNALRHSFASYHLAQHKDAPRTAYELGHTSPKMLYLHYDGVALPKDAAAWWQITPPADFGNVVAFTPANVAVG
jgi:integrase